MITKQDVEGLFGSQLAKIGDPELRDKVVEVWVEACDQSSYETLEELERMPFTLLTDCRGVTFIEHTIAVTEGALAMAEAQVAAYEKMPYAIDFDRLVAGGLLHDVGKVLEIEPDGAGGYRKSRNGMCTRHPISGAIVAGAAGLDDELVNVIACHAKEGDGRPQVVETVFVHQADFATFNPMVMLAAGKLIQ